MENRKEIYVYENWKSDTPSLLGKLYADGGRGRQLLSFEYTEEWLADLTNNATLDPDVGLFKGRYGGKMVKTAGSARVLFGWCQTQSFCAGTGQFLMDCQVSIQT